MPIKKFSTYFEKVSLQIKNLKQTHPLLTVGLITVLAVIILVVIQPIHDNASILKSDAQTVPPSALYVSPSGSDSNSGTSSTSPLKTIQAALNKATAGITINIGTGIYHEKLTTMDNGTVDAPITLKGPETGKAKSGRYQAVVYGPSGRIININHSYYILDGFTVDGQEQLASTQYPTTLSAIRSFKDSVQGRTIDNKLIYIGSADTTHDLTGIVIRNMFLNGAGGECVRLRNRANHNEIVDSVVQWCGMVGKGDGTSQYKYHNAEGIYIGTSPKSTDQPMYANDASAFNYIHNNTVYTYGSECLEVKENAHDNIFENNDCRFNDEPDTFLGSNIELRGYNNKILGNIISDSRSNALKMKSDSTSYIQGGNSVQNNSFAAYTGAAIRNEQSTAQGLFCGNSFTGTILVGNSVGNPTAPCPFPTNTPTPSSTPAPIPPTNTPTPTQIPPTPTLTPNPSPTPTNGTISTTITTKVSQSADDAEENLSDNSVNLTSSDLEMVIDSQAQQIGMRFQKISIPKDAIITNAYIEFIADTSLSGTTNLTFFAEAVDNSLTFTSSKRNITSRIKTGSFVAWNSVPAWKSGIKYQTPNLKSPIQEVVSRTNWLSNNALTIIVSGSGKRVAKSYNNSSSNAPKLVITYTK